MVMAEEWVRRSLILVATDREGWSSPCGGVQPEGRRSTGRLYVGVLVVEVENTVDVVC